jgi:hypothetical protein
MTTVACEACGQIYDTSTCWNRDCLRCGGRLKIPKQSDHHQQQQLLQQQQQLSAIERRLARIEDILLELTGKKKMEALN